MSMDRIDNFAQKESEEVGHLVMSCYLLEGVQYGDTKIFWSIRVSACFVLFGKV